MEDLSYENMSIRFVVESNLAFIMVTCFRYYMLPKIIMEHTLTALMDVSKFDFIDAIGNYVFNSLGDTEILY